MPAETPAAPLLTVFTSTVFADVARIWFRCVRRAFPEGLARFEIFHDSDDEPLDPAEFPGAVILRRTAACREFHDAYNEAVERCRTRYLAIIDSDVFWVSREIWPRVQRELEEPGVAAVACISRSHRKSHGTYSVVLKPEIYRQVMKTLPDGFFPHAETTDTSVPIGSGTTPAMCCRSRWWKQAIASTSITGIAAEK